MTDIKQVARLAGVSPATVSRVINDHPHVSDRTREKVRRVIASEDYHPNALAANLRRKVSDVIGYLQFGRPGIEDGRLAQVAETRLFADGFRTFSGNAGFDMKREEFYLSEMIRQRVAGAILFARDHGEHGQGRRALEAARRLESAGIVSIVLGVNARGSGVSSVSIDRQQGWRLGLEHLKMLGHVHIAYVSAERADIPPPETIADLAPASLRSAVFNADAPLAQGIGTALAPLLDAAPRITALFCATEDIAAASTQYLTSRGMTLPDDISVICFGGTDFGRMVHPRLTTIELPLDDLGALCSEQLLAHIKQRRSPARAILMENQLIIGESTGPAPEKGD